MKEFALKHPILTFLIVTSAVSDVCIAACNIISTISGTKKAKSATNNTMDNLVYTAEVIENESSDDSE